MIYLIEKIEKKLSARYKELRAKAYLAFGNYLLSTKPHLDHHTILKAVSEMEIRGLAPKGITYAFNTLSQRVSEEYVRNTLKKYLTVPFYKSLREYIASDMYGKEIEFPKVQGLMPRLNPASSKEELARLARIREYSSKSAKNHPVRPVNPKPAFEIVMADRPQDWFWAMGDDHPVDPPTQLELPFDE